LVSKIYDVDFYHVDPQDYLIDYDELEKKAFSFRPRIIVSGGTAYPREIDYERIGSIAKKVGAYYLADVSHEAGLIAGGAAKRPFEFADVVSMTTHKTLRGPRGAIIFSRADISRKIDSSVFPGIQGGPHNEVIAGMAIALEKARHKEFREYATQTVRNARVLSSKLMDLNIPLVTSGTDKHLILIDLRPMELNGTRVAASLERAGIIVNKNSVPYDSASAFNPSGVRLGTPAVTARGMREKEMEKIADFIGEVMVNLENEKVLRRIRREVKNLCSDFSDIF
jgi:glycine hydroxymethyltransferase